MHRLVTARSRSPWQYSRYTRLTSPCAAATRTTNPLNARGDRATHDFGALHMYTAASSSDSDQAGHAGGNSARSGRTGEKGGAVSTDDRRHHTTYAAPPVMATRGQSNARAAAPAKGAKAEPRLLLSHVGRRRHPHRACVAVVTPAAAHATPRCRRRPARPKHSANS